MTDDAPAEHAASSASCAASDAGESFEHRESREPRSHSRPSRRESFGSGGSLECPDFEPDKYVRSMTNDAIWGTAMSVEERTPGLAGAERWDVFNKLYVEKTDGVIPIFDGNGMAEGFLFLFLCRGGDLMCIPVSGLLCPLGVRCPARGIRRSFPDHCNIASRLQAHSHLTLSALGHTP